MRSRSESSHGHQTDPDECRLSRCVEGNRVVDACEANTPEDDPLEVVSTLLELMREFTFRGVRVSPSMPQARTLLIARFDSLS